MSRKLITSPKSLNSAVNKAEEVGGCVVCKLRIYSDQEHGRAPKPLLGKAHQWCGGVG